MGANQRRIGAAIFFCQRLDPDHDVHTRRLEKQLGSKVRFFPLPCSGRIEALHLLKAIETGAEKVYLITCPEGDCNHRQGNLRAAKRLDYAKSLIREIDLRAECLEMVRPAAALPLSIDELVRKLLEPDPPDPLREGNTDGDASDASPSSKAFL
jgi:coenzyme F420-reducing hydrogenase delta subunit